MRWEFCAQKWGLYDRHTADGTPQFNNRAEFEGFFFLFKDTSRWFAPIIKDLQVSWTASISKMALQGQHPSFTDKYTKAAWLILQVLIKQVTGQPAVDGVFLLYGDIMMQKSARSTWRIACPLSHTNQRLSYSQVRLAPTPLSLSGVRQSNFRDQVIPYVLTYHWSFKEDLFALVCLFNCSRFYADILSWHQWLSLACTREDDTGSWFQLSLLVATSP